MSTLPVYVSIVAPMRRMSGMVRDAENRARLPMAADACNALARPVKSALVWKNGSGAYTTDPGPSAATLATCTPVLANRPWVQRTALGKPVEPDVKISRKRSSAPAGSHVPLGVDGRERVGVRRGVGPQHAFAAPRGSARRRGASA